MRLVPKLLLTVTITVLITMTLIGGLSYFRTTELIYHQVEHIQTAESEFVSQLYEQKINSIKRTTEIVANSRFIERSLSQGVSRGVNQHLNEIINIYPYFNYAFVLDSENEIFAVNTRDSEGQVLQNEKLLGISLTPPAETAFKTQKVIAEKPQIDPHLSTLTKTQRFYAQIKSGTKTLGWVVLNYNWGKETTAFLKRTQNALLHHDTPILDLMFHDGETIWASATKQASNKFSPSPNWLLARTTIKVGSETFELAIINDKDLALAEVTTEAQYILALTLFTVILLVTFLAIALRKILVRRIEILANGHKQLITNKEDARIPDLGSDEIGELASSFNKLASWLNEATVSKEFVDDIINSTADGLIIINQKSEIQLFNPAAEKIFGYHCEEVSGKPVEILMRPDERESHVNYVNASNIYAPRIIDKARDIWGLRKDGTTFPMDLTVSRVHAAEDTMFVGIVRDVTARKREEDEKARFFSLLEATLESTNNGILVTDLEGNVLQFNSQYKNMWQINDAMLASRKGIELRKAILKELCHPTEFDSAFHHLDENPTEKYYESLELKDGRFFETSANPIYIGETPVGRVWSFSDVSEIKRANEALRELAEEQASLREKAELGEKSKSEFLATMSHEIRTPITGILGMAETLLEEKLSSDNLRKAEIIYDSGHTLLRLLNDILDLSKLEAGKLEIENIDYSINEEVTQVFEILMPRIDKKDLVITRNIDKNCPEAINSDPTRFRQILYNLIGNAVKFTDQGGVTVNISAKTDLKELYVEVVDTGIGIEKSATNNLFNRFQQADSSTARKFGGSGLGLAICKSLTEIMGGEIGVESLEGVGSRFWFTLQYEDAKPNFEKRTIAKHTSKFQCTQALRILVADDSSIIQKVLGQMLKSVQHKVTFADDGAEALAKLAVQTFDLVIMDRRMPQKDGMQTTKVIREKEGIKDLPIIGCTADAMEKYKQEFIQAGVNACISKPIDKAELFTTINEVLNKEIHIPIETAENANADQQEQAIIINFDDFDQLKENVGHDILKTLIEEFMTTTPDQLLDLNNAISSEDGKATRNIAHTIKGSAATFGFVDIVNSSKRIELNNYQKNGFEKVSTELEYLKDSFEKIKTTVGNLEI